MTVEIKRQCEILGIEEEAKLDIGLDFRLPQYRREVFLRFYEFHLENSAHPGAVYYVIPWLIKKYHLNAEERYWLAYINGNTQNIVTSWVIFKQFPDPTKLKGLEDWFKVNYGRLEWDNDRRHHKKEFLPAVKEYVKLTGGKQERYFQSLADADEGTTFNKLWEALRSDFRSFGRLSAFSYSEYLRIIGYGVNCNSLFLDDLSGSRSHRNGLAKVLGREDLDWHKDGTFMGGYADGQIDWLKMEANALFKEARERVQNNKSINQRFVSLFTFESALCTYKSWHRRNRRYPNVYNDMFALRIRHAGRYFPREKTQLFWDCREDCLPDHLRIERCPNDPGLCSDKQNVYLRSGKVIMMSKRWPEFENAFDDLVWGKRGLFS